MIKVLAFLLLSNISAPIELQNLGGERAKTAFVLYGKSCRFYADEIPHAGEFICNARKDHELDVILGDFIDTVPKICSSISGKISPIIGENQWSVEERRIFNALLCEFLYQKCLQSGAVAFNNFPVEADIVRRAFPSVSEVNVPNDVASMLIVSEITESITLKRNPRPLLITHDLVGAPHFSERRVNHGDGNDAQGQTSRSGPGHDLSEEGHLLLRVKVLIGTGMVAGGFYLLINTVPQGFRLKRQTFIINTIFGILYVCLGALFAAYSLFSLVGG